MMRGKLLSVLLCIMLLVLMIPPGLASADSSPISPTFLPEATAGASYSASVSVVGGAGPYTYAMTGLPDALTGSGDGNIAGVPASAGDSTVQVVYDDGQGDNNNGSPASISLHVNNPVALNDAAMQTAAGASGAIGNLAAAGGTAPITYSCTDPSKPAWATVGSDGSVIVTSAPDDAGNYPITVAATDKWGSTAAATLTIVVQVSAGGSGSGGAVSVTGVSLNKDYDTITAGGTDALIATVNPSDATDQSMAWTSDTPGVATVDSAGMLTAVAPGDATITATTEDGGYTATCDVQVYTVSATGVSLNLTSDTITARSDATLVATALIASMWPENTTDQNVVWSSDNPAVATVNQSGEVSAVAPGDATITATTEDGGYTATCAITVITSSTVIPINSAQSLANISNNLTGNYQQTTPIDLTGYSWTPIGDIPYEDAQGNAAYRFESFSGNFNGGGKKITGSELFGEACGTIENVNAGSLSAGDGYTGTSIGGLVGDVPSGTSLTISNCSYTGPLAGINATLTDVGGLVGDAGGDITISNCSYTGPLAGINATLTRVGGLVGSSATLTITNSSFSGTISGAGSTVTEAGGLVGNAGGATTITNGYFNDAICGGDSTLTDVGGLVGSSESTLTITHSSATGAIDSGDFSTLTEVGGLVGNATVPAITDAYFNGTFVGEGSILVLVGGLVGNSNGATATNCYSAAAADVDVPGGILGTSNGADTITSTYYDDDTIAGSDNDIGTPEPTDLMMQQSTFANWDYSNIWAINEGVSYPYFGTSAAANVPVTGVTLNKSTDAIQPGDSDHLVATVQPDDATDQSVTWTSDTPGVATVDQTGLVQAVASGTANITVTTEDGGFTAVCQVIVSASGSSGGGGAAGGVEISNSVSNSTPVVGQEIEYSVSLTNLGPDTTTGVQVTDLLPSGLTFDGYTASQGTYDSTTGVWRVGTMPVEQPAYSAELDIFAAPTNSVAGTTVTDIATLEYNPNGLGSSSVVIQVAALSTTQTYTVAYDGNGSTGGTVPVDGNSYDSGANVIVLDNTGGLSRTGYGFAGWNTAADESGTSYQQGDSFSMGSSDILYAQWKQIVIAISPDSLPGGTVGSSYSQTLTASGGTAPYAFTEAGSLPDGLTLGGDGALTGAPTHAGVSSFTVTATDSSGSACSHAYTLTVDSAQTPTAPPAPIGGGGGGGVSSPPDPLAPQKPVQQASPTSGQPAAPAPPTMQQSVQLVQDSQQPTVQKRPLASLPVGTQSSKQPTVQKSVTQIVSPAPVAVAPVSPVEPAPVAPAPARRNPVLPVVGSLALIAAAIVLIKKRSSGALLALLPFRVVSVAVSLKSAGGGMVSLLFDDKKRRPYKVTVDLVNGAGKTIAKGVVVTRDQSTAVTLPAMALTEKMQITANTRGYRNISKNRSVEFTDR